MQNAQKIKIFIELRKFCYWGAEFQHHLFPFNANSNAAFLCFMEVNGRKWRKIEENGMKYTILQKCIVLRGLATTKNKSGIVQEEKDIQGQMERKTKNKKEGCNQEES